MTDNNQKSELQKNYEAMVNAVEEKLEDVQKISKEKLAQASAELKNNLHKFGDALEGVSDAYKEELKFDIDYVNNAMWEQFNNIANSNTFELMEFTKHLKEQAQNATSKKHTKAHKDLEKWESEHSLWLNEIDLWQQNYKQALTHLAEIESAMQDQVNALTQHAQAIERHVKGVQKHEQKAHAKQSALHETFKTKHVKLIAMLNMLHKEI